MRVMMSSLGRRRAPLLAGASADRLVEEADQLGPTTKRPGAFGEPAYLSTHRTGGGIDAEDEVAGAPFAHGTNHAGAFPAAHRGRDHELFVVEAAYDRCMQKSGAPMAEPVLERERETAEIRGLLHELRAGSGEALFVEGPAGVGKTTLLRAALEDAAAADVAGLTARGSELERDFPYGVVRQLLEPPLNRATERQRARLTSGAAALSLPLFGAEAERERPVAPGADPAFAIVHGLYWLTANLATRQPLLIAVDDAHWADPASMRFLGYLARRLDDLPVLLIVSARTPEPGAEHDSVAAIRSETARSLGLSPLSGRAVALLVRERIGADADPEFCTACHSSTGGNPFLLGELVAALSSDGVEPIAANAQKVLKVAPATVSRWVHARLARTAPEARALARALAVLGRGAELRHAAELAQLDERSAAEALDTLVAAGLAETVEGLDFSHPLLRTAIYADLPPGERSLAHRQAARQLACEEAPAERIAVHLLAAEPAADPAASSILRSAGRRALARGAPQEGITYLRRALAEPPPASERANVLMELGRAETVAFDPAAVGRLQDALEAARDEQERGLAARWLGHSLLTTMGPDEAVVALDRAHEIFARVDPSVALEIDADLVAMAQIDVLAPGLIGDRLERHEPPLEPASRGERLLLCTMAFEAVRSNRPVAVAAELGRRALEDGQLLEEAAADLPPFLVGLWALVGADELDLADASADAALDDARGRGSAVGFASISCVRSASAFRRGLLDDAETHATAALETCGLHGELLLPMAAAVLADALLERGELDCAWQALERSGIAGVPADAVLGHYPLYGRGRVRIARGDVRGGLDDVLTAGAREVASGHICPTLVPWRRDAALAHVALGEVSEARQLADENLGLAREFGSRLALGPALRLHGILHGKAGIAQLAEAVHVLEPSPAHLELARALADLGAAVRRSGRPRDAREPLRRALDLADRCGATVIAELARQELRLAGAKPRREALSGSDALTASERRVARMAASGTTNREIAQSLFVTLRTVETHLTSAYRKLDIDSRTELGRALQAP